LDKKTSRLSPVFHTYDADGERVEKSNGSTGTLYWYMGPGIVGESDLNGVMKSEYIFFAGERIARRDLISPGGVFFYFSDHLKTTSIVTDSSGVIKNESDYYPWGGEVQLIANDSNHYKFNGKERDETGLDYYGARYYSNKLGRFVTPDWAGNAAAVPYANFGNPQSLNLYTYVENNPTTLADLDGHLGQSTAELITSSPTCGTICGDSAGEHSENFCGLDAVCPPPQTTPFHGIEPRKGVDCPLCESVEETEKQNPSRIIKQEAGDKAKKKPHGQLKYKTGVPSAKGKLDNLLKCTQQCYGGDLRVTSTNEPMKGAHQSNTPHGRGEAADLGVPPGQEGKVLACAARCGAGFGLNERAHPSKHATGPHVHIQIPKGTHGGRGDLPDHDH
jgi:RHS repeat-associated protein